MHEKLVEEREKWVERIRLGLLRHVKLGEESQRRLEERNGFQRGYLSQVLKGRIQLTVRHLFGLLLALDLPPERFFAEIFNKYPHRNPDPMIGMIMEKIVRYDAGFRELEDKGVLSPSEAGGSTENESIPESAPEVVESLGDPEDDQE